MIRFVREYFKKTESYSAGRFIAEMSLITIASKVFLSFSILLLVDFFYIDEALFLGQFEDRADSLLDGLHWLLGFVLLCVFVPLFESLVGQMIPISLIRFFSKEKTTQVLFSVIVNTSFHYPFAIYGFIVTCILSFILAWGYILYRKEGIWKAILVITTIHGLYNFIPFMMVYLFPR